MSLSQPAPPLTPQKKKYQAGWKEGLHLNRPFDNSSSSVGHGRGVSVPERVEPDERFIYLRCSGSL